MAVAVAACLVALLALTAAGVPGARVAGAALLVFVLPGYATVSALMPRAQVGPLQRVLFTAVASVALVILGGLVLNATPWGLQTGSWAVYLAAVTLTAGAVAWLRGRRAGAEWQLPRLGLRASQVALLVLALAVAGIALRVATTPPPPQEVQGYTQLWMLTPEPSRPDVVQVGVDNREFTNMRFTVVVLAGGRILYEWSPIRLMPDASWQAILELPPGTLAAGQRLEADLYKVDSPGIVYRHVILSYVPQ